MNYEDQQKIENLAKMLGIKLDINSLEVTAGVRTGETESIIIPKNMSKLQAAQELEKQHEEEETVIDLRHDFSKWDGKDALVAIMKVIKNTFGWVPGKAIQTMFGPINPKELQVAIDIKDGKEIYENCFIGQFVVAAWDNAKGNVGMSQGIATIVFNVKKKHKERAQKFFSDCEQHLLTSSIYKGKSIVVDGDGFSFIENRGSNNIILNDAEERVIQNLVIAPLAKDGKRCILFTGDYGTGKTETAMRVGREANAQQITFMYCKDATKFAKLLDTAKQYQPALIFMEDIDEIGSGEQRDASMNEILNTLDGVQTKGNNITVIFTTNHEDRINKALRRPGRIDVILKFKKCDPSTVVKIYQRLFLGLTGSTTLDFELLAKSTPNVQGAVVAEISKRAKRMAEHAVDGTITDDIVLTAIDSMKDQIDFMGANPEKTIDLRIQALETIADVISSKFKDKDGETLIEKVDKVYNLMS